MLTDTHKAFLDRATAEAIKANHPFAMMAAAEAALESGFGTSELAARDNNLFGTKQHRHPAYGTIILPTREFLDGKWIATSASWVKYPDWRAAFADRFATIERLSKIYRHYAAALAATDPQTYVQQVSLTWSTDPARAAKVLTIYQAYVAEKKNEGSTTA